MGGLMVEDSASQRSLSSILSSKPSSIASIPSLLSHLTPPLVALSLLAPAASTSSIPLPSAAQFLRRQLQLVQLALLSETWLTWLPAATTHEELEQLEHVLTLYFVPPEQNTEGDGTAWGAEVALASLASLLAFLARPSTKTSAAQVELASGLLEKLLARWTMDRIARSLWSGAAGDQAVAQEGDDKDDEESTEGREDFIKLDTWQVYVKDLAKVPGRVANAWGSVGRMRDVPSTLQTADFEAGLTSAYLTVLQIPNLPLAALSLPIFLTSALPTAILPRLLPPPFPASPPALLARFTLEKTWHRLLPSLTSTQRLKLFSSTLSILERFLGASEHENWIQAASMAIFLLAGEVERETLEAVLDPRRSMGAGMAKAIGFWIDRSGSTVTTWAVQEVEAAWCDEESVKVGSTGSRIFITALFLHLLSSQPTHASKTAHSPPFLSAVSLHLSHQNATVRHLGLMLAEEVSVLEHNGNAVKSLSFGELWQGVGEEVVVAQRIRKLGKAVRGETDDKEEKDKGVDALRKHFLPSKAIAPIIPTPVRKVVAPPPAVQPAPMAKPLIVDLSDPSDLQPYPLPPAPSISLIEELETPDPSLYATYLPKPSSSSTRPRGKLRPPVYVYELTEYLRGKDPNGGNKEEADEEAERVEVGLQEGEALLRRKMGWGGEVEENAVNLALVLAGLQDQFETKDFEPRKLGIMMTLVVAAPTKAAPAFIEHYFMPNYTLQQRHAILMALALASRELAGLANPAPVPTDAALDTPILSQSARPAPITLFPSKQLPPKVHARLAPANPTQTHSAAPLLSLPSGALEAIVSSVTSSALSSAREEAETSIPEARKEKLLTVRRFASSKAAPRDLKGERFSVVAAEFFLLPLINRLFLHLRDRSTGNSSRTSGSFASLSGGDASALLDALLLPTYLGTLAVMLHAARHSSHFISVLAPDSLELLLVLHASVGASGVEEKVVQGEMECLLVVFDALVALDGGRTLMRDKNELVGECQEWAEEVFEREERKPGGVGASGRAAAGVLLRIDEILRGWRGKVGW